MTITSVGYAGTVDDEQWARLIPAAGGAFYSVETSGAFRVTAAAGTRTVQIAGGTGGASAYGVRAVSDTAVQKPLDAVPSGTRWDMIVLRRNWATKQSTIEVVQGGSARALPARTNNPGIADDQPLALVRVAAGQTTIQEIVDLRCAVHNGGAVAWDDLVRTYLDQLGTSVRIGNNDWTRVTNASGAATWVSSDETDTGWVNVPRGAGWSNGHLAWHALRVRRVGVLVSIRGLIQNTTASASILNMATVPNGFRPAEPTPLGVYHSSSGHFGELIVSNTGVLSGVAGYYSGSLPVKNYIPVHGNWFVY